MMLTLYGTTVPSQHEGKRKPQTEQVIDSRSPVRSVRADATAFCPSKRLHPPHLGAAGIPGWTNHGDFGLAGTSTSGLAARQRPRPSWALPGSFTPRAQL